MRTCFCRHSACRRSPKTSYRWRSSPRTTLHLPRDASTYRRWDRRLRKENFLGAARRKISTSQATAAGPTSPRLAHKTRERRKYMGHQRQHSSQTGTKSRNGPDTYIPSSTTTPLHHFPATSVLAKLPHTHQDTQCVTCILGKASCSPISKTAQCKSGSPKELLHAESTGTTELISPPDPQGHRYSNCGWTQPPASCAHNPCATRVKHPRSSSNTSNTCSRPLQNAQEVSFRHRP